MEADLARVDMVAELIDARIPISSRNPDIDVLVGKKPRLVVLNRAGQADSDANAAWTDYFQGQGMAVLETDSKTGRGVDRFAAAARSLLREQLARWQAKGQVGRPVRAMVVGVPNVGKSTFINRLARRRSAKAEDRPGVTRGKQWVVVDAGLALLDTPGILWPRFENERVGLHLAYTGAVKDDVMDVEGLACQLMSDLAAHYPETLEERYRLRIPPREEGQAAAAFGYGLLEAAAQGRGMRARGGEADTQRMARVLLDELRSGKLGRLTLEFPGERMQ